MGKTARTGPREFTIDMPLELPVRQEGDHWWMEHEGRELRLSNLKKIWWPEEGFTKGDVLRYYWNVAPLIIPHLRERPLTRKRMPNGIDGEFFYEKEKPAGIPEWVPYCPVLDAETGKVINYLTAPDAGALLFVANLGAIEMHPLHARCHSIDLPDYLFFDLDPFEPATFDDVRIVARHVRAALDALGLASYPKISGATGMQIFVPILQGPLHEHVREFVGTIGRMILRADPQRVTMEWQIAKRTGKIFIDHNMNRSGANIASVYSVRPERGGTVSTPVSWDEVEAGCHPSEFTMATVHARFAERGDLFRGVIDNPADIRDAMRAVGLNPDYDVEAPPRVTVEGGTPKDRRLAEYIKKRSFSQTPEPPPGDRVASTQPIFVIHKHNATRLHYDLRLEHDGALESWAVPKGLPTTPGEKRLAVQTEPHPMEYADFEGWIPEGHYGAGESLIFDRGTYDKLEAEPGKWTIRLHGRRHTGEYHLVKTAHGWLIFLSRSHPGDQPPAPPAYLPMLAEHAGMKPFDDPKWRFEPKLDGIRTIATVTTDGTRLISRNARDVTHVYPELSNLAMWVNGVQAVIDGEIVVADEQGRPSFEKLQSRMNLSNPREIDRMRKKLPVTLFAFDLLWHDGSDLTREPLEARRELLETIITPSDRLRLAVTVDGDGTKLFEAAKKLGFEGVVAKRIGSRYDPGRRSKDWRKIKAVNRLDCVIIGWTRGEGSRSSSFGALLLGAYDDDGALRWIGQVGTGFTDGHAADVLAKLQEIEQDEPALDDSELTKAKDHRWVRPDLVCDVEYLQMTGAKKLRAPSYKGLRPDKVPTDCLIRDAIV